MDNNNQNQQDPIYQEPHPHQNGSSNAKGKATAALVLGIVSAVFCWVGYVNLIAIILSIIGIVLAVGARKELTPENGRGMATAGLVLSIISLVLSSIFFVSCVMCIGALGSALPYMNY